MAVSESTNLSLQTPVNEGIQNQDLETAKAALAANNAILEKTLSGNVAIGTNPSIVDTAGNRIVKLYSSSAGSIATIAGALTGVPFTLIMQSSGASLSLLDAGDMLLSAAWTPDTQYDNLTLVWDGSRYIELGRTAV